MIMMRSALVPKRMRTLERDHRGYPVPFIVLRDNHGKPRFAINDHLLVGACLSKKLCSICGKRLDADIWFVGGSRAFLHNDGVFIDPPLHYECAEYSLRVCPFLAAPAYSKSVITISKVDNIREDLRLKQVEYSGPSQPERFALGCTHAYRRIKSQSAPVVLAIDHWDYLEWWRNGERCEAPDAVLVLTLAK